LIAADRLTPAALAEVADLVGSDAVRAMEEASTWADYIRLSRPDTAPWHYVNIEVAANGFNAATRSEPIFDADRLVEDRFAQQVWPLRGFASTRLAQFRCCSSQARPDSVNS